MAEASQSKAAIAADFEPSEFQAEIIAMSIDEFVALTNIEEIVREELQRRAEMKKRPATAAAFIKLFYEKRIHIDQWGSCRLKNLKYKLCECKRCPKSTANAMVQSDARIQQDVGTQYELDFECRATNARQASEGDGVALIQPSSQLLTQTENSQDNPRNSDERVDSPEVNAAQNVSEPMDMDTAAEVDGDLNEAVLMQPISGYDSAEANGDVEMIDLADANRHCESVSVTTGSVLQPVLINDTNDLHTENMVEEMMHKTTDGTDISVRSVDLTQMEMERKVREQMHESKRFNFIENDFICKIPFRLFLFQGKSCLRNRNSTQSVRSEWNRRTISRTQIRIIHTRTTLTR